MSTHIPVSDNIRSSTSSRRPLRSPIKLAFRDSQRLLARTINIATDGLTMMSPLQIARGKVCDICIDLLLGGKRRQIYAVSTSVECVCVGCQGFRTNLRFLDIDPDSQQILSEFVRHGPF